MSRMDQRKPGRRTRRRFSDEFKEQTVRLVLDEGKTVNAVARELDLGGGALGKHALTDRTKGKTGLTREEREALTRLRKHNRILQEERDILKKYIRTLFRILALARKKSVPVATAVPVDERPHTWPRR